MRRMTPITAVLALGMTLAGTGAAISQPNASGMSPERLERVTAVLDKHMAAGNIAGAVSLIYRHGEVAHLSARGFQDMDAKTPMQRDTIFGLASMTKPITAVAAMMLVEVATINSRPAHWRGRPKSLSRSDLSHLRRWILSARSRTTGSQAA